MQLIQEYKEEKLLLKIARFRPIKHHKPNSGATLMEHDIEHVASTSFQNSKRF